MHQVTLAPTSGPYVLATGEAAAYRLRLLHNLYEEGTRRVLHDAGLRRRMHSAPPIPTVNLLFSPQARDLRLESSRGRVVHRRGGAGPRLNPVCPL
jgi:hypothetical protein